MPPTTEQASQTLEAEFAKSVVPNVDSPLADPERPWDGDAARKRVKQWATSGDEMDWEKYRKAFTWWDSENPEVQSSYKLPHHDIIDGELKVVLRGVQSARGVMNGAMGGVDMPDSERAKAMAHLDYHMNQFGYDEDDYDRDEEERAQDSESPKRVAVFDTKVLVDTSEKASTKLSERTVTARISTTSVDREGDVLLPSGLDLRDFKKNPVVLLGHSDSALPVGKATSIRRESDGVVATVKFAERPAGHPDSVEWIPDTIFSLFQQGVLKAFSVGFIPQEMREPTEKDVRKFGEDVRSVITKWSLLEFSVVNVPANQDALVQQVAKSHKWLADAWGIDCGQTEAGGKEKTMIKRWSCDAGVPRLKLN